MEDIQGRKIGRISNDIGGLVVKENKGQFFWGVEGHKTTNWQEIPQALYLGLLAFEYLGTAG